MLDTGFNSFARARALRLRWCAGRPCAGRVHAVLDRFQGWRTAGYEFAGNNKSNPNCVGENISPRCPGPTRRKAPRATHILMFDLDGRPPGGVTHWVAYGIPASVTGFAEGEVSKPSDKYVGGQSLMKLANYFGPCTPPGPPHHYIFTLMATDLEPPR